MHRNILVDPDAGEGGRAAVHRPPDPDPEDASRVGRAPSSGAMQRISVPGTPRVRVVVVGGGIAAVETAIALARNGDAAAIDVTVVSETPAFVYRPLVVTEPFGGRVPRIPLRPLLGRFGVGLHRSRVEAVDCDARRILLADGSWRRYDALVTATGAALKAPRPGGLTLGIAMPEAFGRLLRGLESGSTQRVAFAVPSRHVWSLPVYEMALQTAAHLDRLGIGDRLLTVVTPERAPLEVFGARAGDAVAALLNRANIGLRPSTYPVAALHGELRVAPGAPVPADEIVWGPTLEPRSLAGLPTDAKGFVPTDPYGRVQGLDGVYAAGDITSGRLKQGGLAGQQAATAAASLIASVDRGAVASASDPVLRAMLLTGSDLLFLKSRISDEGPVDEVVSDQPLWSPPAKVATPHVGGLLAMTQYQGRHA